MSLDRYDFIRRVLVAKTVADEGSIRKAANVLGVTPSALSQSIASLEKQLQKTLFQRGKGSLVPTQECLDYLAKIRPALGMFDELLPSPEKKLTISHLDIGFYDSLAITMLPRLILALRSDFPKVKINVLTSRSSTLVSMVRQGELCVAFVVETDNMGGLIFEGIGREQFGIYCAQRFSENPTAAARELGLGYLTAGASGVHPVFVTRFTESLGRDYKIAMQCDSFETLAAVAAEGVVAAVLPERVAQRYSDSLVEVPLPTEIKRKSEHRLGLLYTEKCDAQEARYLHQLLQQTM